MLEKQTLNLTEVKLVGEDIIIEDTTLKTAKSIDFIEDFVDEVLEMVWIGKSDEEIKEYMLDQLRSGEYLNKKDKWYIEEN